MHLNQACSETSANALESRAHNQYLSWLREVAALQASAEVLQLHRCFRGLPALQGFAQAALRAGSAAGKPSVGSLLCDCTGMMCNVLTVTSCP